MQFTGGNGFEEGRFRPEGASVVVIGGSSGIGLASAEAAHAAGASVTIVGRSQEKLEYARTETGNETSAFPLDVTDRAAVEALFSRVERMDHLLVSAAATTSTRIDEDEIEEVRPTVDIRLWGGLHAAKYTARRMESGSITFMSGTSAWRPYPGSSVVAASGGAIEALGRALALELAPIRVNTICAGIVDTPLLEGFYGEQRGEILRELESRLPVGRIGRPEDIADGQQLHFRHGASHRWRHVARVSSRD